MLRNCLIHQVREAIQALSVVWRSGYSPASAHAVPGAYARALDVCDHTRLRFVPDMVRRCSVAGRVFSRRGAPAYGSRRLETLLRAVMHVVQFEAEPLRAVDRVLAEVIDQGALRATPQAYRTALAQALASDEALAALIPQPHPETTVRQYVALLYQRLRE
jgi:hypothetical protein